MSGIITDGKKNLSADPRSLQGKVQAPREADLCADPAARTEPRPLEGQATSPRSDKLLSGCTFLQPLASYSENPRDWANPGSVAPQS